MPLQLQRQHAVRRGAEGRRCVDSMPTMPSDRRRPARTHRRAGGRHRWRRQSVSRWPNHDPIGEKGGRNLYAFVHNNPLSNVDPCGRSVWSDWKTGWKCLTGSGPCRKMISDRMWEASNWANSYFGLPGQMHSNAGSIADLLSHCVGACEVAKGESVCKSVGIDARGYLQWREFDGVIFPGEPKNPDSEIDLLNNEVGFGIADKGEDCKTGCLRALNAGELWTLQGGNVSPYQPPPPPQSLP
jgi:RHS repeat-associated protein